MGWRKCATATPTPPVVGASVNAEPRLRADFKDPLFAGPLVHLLYAHRREVPDAEAGPVVGVVDFIECFVGDLLVRVCRRAGTALFLKYARAATAQPPAAMLHAAWPSSAMLGGDDDAATRLAVNACRHLWEEALPTIMLATQRLPLSDREEEEELRLRFCEAEMRYDWVLRHDGGEDKDEDEALLRSFRARQARRA